MHPRLSIITPSCPIPNLYIYKPTNGEPKEVLRLTLNLLSSPLQTDSGASRTLPTLAVCPEILNKKMLCAARPPLALWQRTEAPLLAQKATAPISLECSHRNNSLPVIFPHDLLHRSKSLDSAEYQPSPVQTTSTLLSRFINLVNLCLAIPPLNT